MRDYVCVERQRRWLALRLKHDWNTNTFDEAEFRLLTASAEELYQRLPRWQRVLAWFALWRGTPRPCASICPACFGKNFVLAEREAKPDIVAVAKALHVALAKNIASTPSEFDHLPRSYEMIAIEQGHDVTYGRLSLLIDTMRRAFADMASFNEVDMIDELRTAVETLLAYGKARRESAR